jgi:hypothetical protein
MTADPPCSKQSRRRSSSGRCNRYAIIPVREQLDIRYKMKVYRERGGHCTRCWGAFGGNMTAHIVRETIAHTIIGDGAVHYVKWTPVCDACATPKEQAAATILRNCIVCAQRMLCPSACSTAVCSSRCYQRRLRARRKSSRKSTCSACGLIFTPKRSDARYCSNACRQRAHRQAGAAEPSGERQGHMTTCQARGLAARTGQRPPAAIYGAPEAQAHSLTTAR